MRISTVVKSFSAAGLSGGPVWAALSVLAAGLVWPVSALAIDPEPSAAQGAFAWRVLFIGNSYTKNNGLPTMFGEIVRQSGRVSVDVEISQLTIPEWTLEMHWNKGEARQSIETSRWDYVVLQEQSTRPLTDPKRMQDSVGRFSKVLKTAGAQGVLLTTWAQAGEPQTQQSINATYMDQGKTFGLTVAPVGLAWAQAVLRVGAASLYAKDGRHPSKAGTFLAACTLYHHLFRDDKPCPAPTVSGLDSAELEALNQAALNANQGAQ